MWGRGLGGLQHFGVIMAGIFYSHRLKTVLKQTVVELGVRITLDDHGADISIRENEAMIQETARLVGVKCEILQNGDSVVAMFYK